MEKREILFRGKSKSTGEWVEGLLIINKLGSWVIDDSNPHYCSEYGYIEIDLPKKVIPETVGQFTGLLDKNGVKIFDNDIMKDRFGAICQIVYVAEYGGYRQLSKIGYSPLNQAEIVSSNDEIIGNIHDNQEKI